MPDRPATTRAPAASPSPARRGFTVVEVLVALVVVTVGLLGVAGASAGALRAASAALREQAAVTRARTRLTLLTAAGCAGAASGEVRDGSEVIEQWGVGPVANRVRLVQAQVEWNDTHRRRALLMPSALLC